MPQNTTHVLTLQTYEKGNISKHLADLKVGESIMVKGPKGKFVYTEDLAPHLLMIAGGTGITPMFQIIKSSLKNPDDKTQLRLIYANVNEDDIRECWAFRQCEARADGSPPSRAQGSRGRLERPSRRLRECHEHRRLVARCWPAATCACSWLPYASLADLSSTPLTTPLPTGPRVSALSRRP